jgi:hypothetical protein
MIRLEHSRNTRDEGVETSFGILMSVLILVVVQSLLFPFMWAWSPWGVIAIDTG